MKEPCGNTHPLYNPGSIQLGRRPKLLDPNDVVYEDRTVSDWLVYLSKYAEHINFFGLSDTKTASHDWTTFFNQDVSVLLAKIVEEQVSQIQKESNALLYSLQHDNLTDSQAKKSFTLLLGQALNIVYRLNNYYQYLEPTAALKKDIERRVITLFETRLKRLIAYLKSAQNQDLLDEITDENLPNKGAPISDIKNWTLLKMWFSNSSEVSWNDYVDSIAADDSPYLSNVINAITPKAKLNLAARYQLFVESLKGVLSGFAGVVSSAKKEFDLTISDWPSHQPDRALLLSFLKLLELYRKELNTFNKRHLDYHLKDVLQLKPAEASPDKVFLVAELAKTKEEAFIEQGTELTGGKDEEGNLLTYATNEDVIVNRASVAVTKGLLKTPSKIVAAQNTATTDGLEEELEFPEEGWSAFGLENMPEARLGFAVASDVLDMKDGTRTIYVQANIIENSAFNHTKIMAMASRISMRVTTEEGWANLTGVHTRSSSASQLVFRGVLGPDEGPVVPFNKETHESIGYMSQPVVEVDIQSQDHAYLQQFEVSGIAVKVSVSRSKQAYVSTIQGEVDTSKPFVAFGALPSKSNSVVIGAQEMLSKPLTAFSLNATWSSAGDDERSAKDFTESNSGVLFQQLQGGTWVNKSVSLSNSGNTSVYAWTGITQEQNIKTEAFGPKSTRGFIRLALANDLAHKGYANELSTRMAEIAVKGLAVGEAPNIPEPYHVPSIEKLTISYTAQSAELGLAESKNYNPKKTRFYYITPFGKHESSGNTLGVDNPPLVTKQENEGEFYIGLQNAKNGQRVNILIHVLEGSANPLKAKQEVTWHLLSNNRWVDFESGELQDGTDGLIKTGIVSAAIPFTFKTSGTYFSENYLWIRASVKQHADAVCKIIGVYAQGLAARLSSLDHAEAHYENGLPAEHVTKLKRSNPALKKITQPVSSRGGKAPEESNSFYTRISERLRHKDRGITLWDYERMVLQEFPALSMCKTLTHTKYHVDEVTNETEYSESTPGHVAMVCVPVKTELFKPAQKPFTPIDTLEDVKNYMTNKMPPWSTLHVRNPLFEEVQVDARVEFNDDIKDTDYYLEVLNEELKALFSPWRKDDAKGLRFNWRVHKSHVIDFIDERPYINYVRDVKLNLIYGPTTADRKHNVQEAIPRYAVSVLISAPSHVLNLVS